MQTLEKQFDYILIDTAAGISENVIRFLQSAQYAVVVISPEPTSLTDAFSLIKVLQRRHYDRPIYTLVNMANNYKHSMDVFKRFAHAINKYVHIKVRYLGYIPMDRAMRSAVAAQPPVVISEPHAPAARCISLLSQILAKHFKSEQAPKRSISQFWRSQGQVSDIANKPPASSVTDIGITREASEALSNQQDKETSRILALTKDVLGNQEFSQSQSEELLACLLKNYQVEFGTLPQQDITLLQRGRNQLAPERSSQPSPEAPARLDKMDAAPAPRHSIQDQIDNLVTDAERSKQELSDLANHLKRQYQTLYNTDIDASKAAPQPLRPAFPAADQATTDWAGLKQSLRYAAAVDKLKE